MVEPTTKLIAYSFIGIVGVLGNAIVLLSIFKVTHMLPTTKKFIANLATVDLIINLVNIPWKIINIMHPGLSDNEYWVAVIRCKAMPYIAESLTAALINTLVALTVDRYIAIVHPFSTISNRQYTMIMIMIWSCALIFSMPEMLLRHVSAMLKFCIEMKFELPIAAMIFLHYGPSEIMAIGKCDLVWPSNSLKIGYYGFDICENCIIPVCIIIFCYVVVWRVIKQRQIPGEGAGCERRRRRVEKENMKVTKIILAITTYFALSGLPLYIAFFVHEFNRDERNQELNHSVQFWLDWLALTHLFMNPFLYCLLSTHIRNTFKNLIQCGAGAVTKDERASLPNTVCRTTITSYRTSSTARSSKAESELSTCN